MALTDVEQKATSLLGQGGMQAPASVGPSEPEPLMQVAGPVDKISAKAARIMFGEGGGILEKGRQKARDLNAPQPDELGNIPLPPEGAVPGVALHLPGLSGFIFSTSPPLS